MCLSTPKSSVGGTATQDHPNRVTTVLRPTTATWDCPPWPQLGQLLSEADTCDGLFLGLRLNVTSVPSGASGADSVV